jgi:hypothetical protein
MRSFIYDSSAENNRYQFILRFNLLMFVSTYKARLNLITRWKDWIEKKLYNFIKNRFPFLLQFAVKFDLNQLTLKVKIQNTKSNVE